MYYDHLIVINILSIQLDLNVTNISLVNQVLDSLNLQSISKNLTKGLSIKFIVWCKYNHYVYD
jgi:hypothetical protein